MVRAVGHALLPTARQTKLMIKLDKEIKQEIKGLWKQGIKTIESCSGHKKGRGCIIVKKSSVKKMEELGYERELNTGQWYSFYPKTK